MFGRHVNLSNRCQNTNDYDAHISDEHVTQLHRVGKLKIFG